MKNWRALKMGYIEYNLTNGARLGGMVPQALAGGDFTNAQLPKGLEGAGIYMIVNTNGMQHNRYIGISTNLEKRFSSRMNVVTELGFDFQTMQNIGIYWGKVRVADTLLFPNWREPILYGAPFVAKVDNRYINLEQLLIRITKSRWVHGDTISNNIFTKRPYANLTQNDIEVTVKWDGKEGIFEAGKHTQIWKSGEAW